MKEKLKKLEEILSWIFMFAAFILLIMALISAYQHKDSNEPNYVLGYGAIRAISGSMEPTFAVNGIAIIKEVHDMNDIAVDDIVTFRVYSSEGKISNVTHRIVEIKDNGIITTKGDNNEVSDMYPLTIDHIDSKVVFIFNGSAWIFDKLLWLKHHPITAGCFGLSIVLFGFSLHFIRQSRKEKQELSDISIDVLQVKPDEETKPNHTEEL